MQPAGAAGARAIERLAHRVATEELHQRSVELLEVHVASPLEWCEARDPGHVYERARAGELVNVAGVDTSYEPPETPVLVLRPGSKHHDKHGR